MHFSILNLIRKMNYSVSYSLADRARDILDSPNQMCNI